MGAPDDYLHLQELAMHPYGNNRKDNETCDYGCCTTGKKKTRHRRVHKATLRAARKRARRQAKGE